jgi:hypothetical protein
LKTLAPGVKKKSNLIIKTQNAEGFVRILQPIILLGENELLVPLAKLFSLVYSKRKVPEQWLVVKTIPEYKFKGEAKTILELLPQC